MPEMTPSRLDATGHVLLRIARLLLGGGADSAHVHQRIETLAGQLGIEVQFFTGSERLLLMIASEGTYRTRVGHALGMMGIDAGRLVAVDEVVTALGAGRLDVEAADARLAEIEAHRSGYPDWIVVLAVAATAAALARLFGAAWPVVGAAFGAGLVNALVRLWLGRRGVLPAAVAALTACASGACAILPLRLTGDDPTLALVAAGMILVPGVPLINGIRDLVQGHAAIGLGRLANGIVVVLAIATGLSLASLIGGAAIPVSLQTTNLPIGWDVLFATVCALGYALVFGAPLRAIPPILLCGALAHGLRTTVMALGGDIALGTLLGAFAAGLMASQVASRVAAPWTVFVFPAVVAMVPGSYAFRAMIGGLQLMRPGAENAVALLTATASALIGALVLTTAIAIGLLVASALHAVPLRRT